MSKNEETIEWEFPSIDDNDVMVLSKADDLYDDDVVVVSEDEDVDIVESDDPSILGEDDVYVIGYGDDVADLDIPGDDDVEVMVDIDYVNLQTDPDVMVFENGALASDDGFVEEYLPDDVEGDDFLANYDGMDVNVDNPGDFIDDAPLI
ncbi:MAG: hypothetical protein IKR05_13010 [Prevotella sp.]|nr:hypothetical protein [Prevotella sp.]MBR6264119.1 hypothetical protein [Prevotella sp.]